MYDSRVSSEIGNEKIRQIASLHLRINQLEISHLVVSIGIADAKHRHIASFVHIFANAFDRFYGLTVRHRRLYSVNLKVSNIYSATCVS